jgi:protein-tyrosine phosphatase
MSEPFVDIHCHLLPGLDDGAGTMDDALAMAEMAAADGIRTVIATPHQLGNNAGNSGEAIRRATARMQEAIDRRRLPLRVVPGADVRIEPDLAPRIQSGQVVTLADRRRHVLIELPHGVWFPLERLLAELKNSGVTAILSHPERNAAICRRPRVLRSLVEQGCLAQVTAGSLTGNFGAAIEKTAGWMVRHGLVHFVATDAHDVRGRPPLLRPAFQRVVELAGEAAAMDLFCRRPADVVAGSAIAPAPPDLRTSRWRGWLRRTFVSEPVPGGTI